MISVPIAAPESDNVNVVPDAPVVGVTVAVPAAGVPVHGLLITAVAVLVQPLASVPVTVYIVVAEGEAVTVAPHCGT